MNRLTFVVVVAALLLLTLFGLLLLLGPVLESRVIPGLRLWGAALGGLRAGDALVHAEDYLALDALRVVFVGPDEQRWSFSPADLGVSVAAEATLTRVLEPGHGDGGWEAYRERVGIMQQGAVVAPVFVWNRNRAEAQLQTLASQLDSLPQDAVVYLQGAEVHIEASSIGRRLDITATLASLEPHLRFLDPVEVPLIIEILQPEVNDEEAAQALEMANVMLAEPLTLLLPNPQEGDPGPWILKPEVVSQMLAIRPEEGHVVVGLDEAMLLHYLESLALALHRDPVDAQFRYDVVAKELVIASPSQPGRDVDLAGTIARINEFLQTGQHLVPLVLQTISPQYDETTSAADLGIVELIAVGESYFVGSSSARDHNIRLGASKFDGVLVAPGETFSFNTFLGEVTPDAGYDESYVIVGDRTVPGVGGGICQVATTAFRAAFYAGYPIIERWPHAYRVGYYELGGFGPGFDATIYSPLVDFRFVNDSSHHLLIQIEIDVARSRLQFLFYSTSDGRTVEQIGPEWGDPVSPGLPVYEYDPTLPSGAIHKLESAHDGLDAVLERVVRDAEGKVLYRDRFESHFVPWPARYVYGPDVIPPDASGESGDGE
ncbi:MAG: VanW family protein [Anaerolineae bacterium]|nr:VanW family protein [Anaerolineae bacterium]